MSDIYLIADLFCGAGGSSTGSQRAIKELGGRMELVAVNHWPTAIATHSANHSAAKHIVEDVSLVDPEEAVPGGRLDLLMASPECRYYSRARGGKPVHDQGRMNPWAVHNWLTRLDVRCVLIENVAEFTNWGPLDERGKPIKARAGEFFQAWFHTFANLGYEARFRELNSADYGDATSRRRFFLIARKDGKPVQWPEPSHAKGDTGFFPGRLPWRGAREVIDWSGRGRSLLDDPTYHRRPLAVKTRLRIAKGLLRYGGPLAPLFIRLLDLPEDLEPAYEESAEAVPFVLNRHGENGGSRCKAVTEPMATATTRGAGYLVIPEVARFQFANRAHNTPRSLDEPIAAATTAHGGGSCLVSAEVKPFVLGQQSGAAPRDTDAPLPTIATAGAISLVNPIIVEYYGRSSARDTGQPLSTFTCEGNHHALLTPIITHYNGHGGASSIEKPVPTITTKERFGLVEPVLVETAHGGEREGRVHSVDSPLPTQTAVRSTALAQPTAEPAGSLDIPMDPRRLVSIDGQLHILDLRFRMLRNAELAKAMGFDREESRYEFVGNVGEVTRQIGNAVPVHLAAALVKAILGGEGKEGESDG